MKQGSRAGAQEDGWCLEPVIVASAVAACLPLLLHGPLPPGSDVFSTAHYLMAFMRAFGEGDLYPRWTDQTNLGLGAPSFILLTPLPYYGASAAVWLTGSPIAGLKLYFVVLSLASGAAFYLLAADWLRPGLPAALSAGLYLLLPYHGLDRYQRFALSESTAFLFFPLILLFARRTVRGRGGGAIVGLAVSYAGLIYTHLVSALMFSLILGLWLLWETRAGWRALLRPALGLALGLGMAAPALLPAALEKGASNIAWTREMPNGDFRINFIFKDDLLPGLGFRDPVRAAGATVGPLTTGAGAIRRGAGPLLERTIFRGPAARYPRDGGGCFLAYFLQLEISTPVWWLVPELPSIQFPWRFQTFMVLSSALLFGFALQAGWGASMARGGRRSLMGAGALALGLIVLVNLALCWQNTTLKPYRIDERTFQVRSCATGSSRRSPLFSSGHTVRSSSPPGSPAGILQLRFRGHRGRLVAFLLAPVEDSSARRAEP